ncbi:MAG: hypothetical protein LBR50_02345, partial [Tannerella sp.]|nr:hypothetical protein [Tannerella sp.]
PDLRKQVDVLVWTLFPNPLVEVIGSQEIDVSVSKLQNGMTAVHLVNTSGEHKKAGIIETIEPVGPLTITLRCDKKPSAMRLQPSGKVLDFDYVDGKAIATVNKVDIYDIVVIEGLKD